MIFDGTGAAVGLSWLIQTEGNSLYEMIEAGAPQHDVSAQIAGAADRLITAVQKLERVRSSPRSLSLEVAQADCIGLATRLTENYTDFDLADVNEIVTEMMTRDHAHSFWRAVETSDVDPSTDPPPARKASRSHLRAVPSVPKDNAA